MGHPCWRISLLWGKARFGMFLNIWNLRVALSSIVFGKNLQRKWKDFLLFLKKKEMKRTNKKKSLRTKVFFFFFEFLFQEWSWISLVFLFRLFVFRNRVKVNAVVLPSPFTNNFFHAINIKNNSSAKRISEVKNIFVFMTIMHFSENRQTCTGP